MPDMNILCQCRSQICAVVGGIFTVAGLVDSAPRHGVECLQVSQFQKIQKDFARISKVLHKSIVHLAKKARPLCGFQGREEEKCFRMLRFVEA